MRKVPNGNILCVLVVVVELDVLSGMNVLAAARDGNHVVVPDHGRRADCGILVTLSQGGRDTLDRAKIFPLLANPRSTLRGRSGHF